MKEKERKLVVTAIRDGEVIFSNKKNKIEEKLSNIPFEVHMGDVINIKIAYNDEGLIKKVIVSKRKKKA